MSYLFCFVVLVCSGFLCLTFCVLYVVLFCVFGVCLPPSFPGQLCFVSCLHVFSLFCFYLSLCQGSVTARFFLATIFGNHNKQS